MKSADRQIEQESDLSNSGRIRSYRDLDVWQVAMSLAEMSYRDTRDFPREETYGMTSQIRRAATSIPANIAEGQGREHSKEFAYHLSVAKGSIAELHTLLIVAQRLGYLETAALQSMEEELSQVRRPLIGLMSKLRDP